MNSRTATAAETFYNQTAELYDIGKQKNLYYFQSLVSLYRSYVPPKSTVIEIGTGTGDLISYLDVARGTGWDISDEMIKIAKRKYGHLSALHYERHNIFDSTVPFEADYIILADVLEHIENLPTFLKQMSQRSRPGTTVVISVLNPVWEWLMYIVEKLHMKIPEGPHHRFTIKETEQFFKDAGFILKERNYRLLVPKKLPFSDAINRSFYKNKLLARWGFTIYWVLVK